MKKFNKLTEKQMSKKSGGFLLILGIAGGAAAAGALATIGGLAADKAAKDKN